MVKRGLSLNWMSALAGALGAAALGGAAHAATGADAYYSAAFNACNKTAMSTLEMHACQDAEYAKWDKQLNQVYQALMASRSADARIQLRDDERAWLARTKLKCDHAGDDNAGGTLQGLEISGCYLDEHILRTVYLRGLH
jgi:uncharacterized protein YecT (DUF1311 family)